MLATKNGHKDIVLILAQKGANLDLVNRVSVHVHMLYEKSCIIKDKIEVLSLKTIIGSFTNIMKSEILSLKNANVMHIKDVNGIHIIRRIRYKDSIIILLKSVIYFYNMCINQFSYLMKKCHFLQKYFNNQFRCSHINSIEGYVMKYDFVKLSIFYLKLFEMEVLYT